MRLCIGLCVVLLSVAAHAQDEGALTRRAMRQAARQQRAAARKEKFMPDPGKSLLYSTLFPGLGQIYNRKYWKAPIVLGGLVGGALLIDFQHNRYGEAKRELYGLLRDSNFITPSGRSEQQLRSEIDNSRRNRDLFTTLTIVWYVLQAIEAHVDAHLQFFAINPKLNVRVEPALQRTSTGRRYAAMAVTLRF